MRIHLTQTSPFVTHRSWSYLEHLGLLFLEKNLLNYGFDVDIFDATWDWADAETTATTILSSFEPYGLVGFSVNRSNFPSTIEVVRLLRSAGFNGHITLGGYFPTFHFKKILSNFPEIDSIILGHGEYPLLNLCQNLREGKSVESVPGLSYRVDKKLVRFSHCHESEEHLKTIGIPNHRPRYGVSRIITSRGCRWTCTFCCVNVFDRYSFQRRYHRRNLDEVLEEVYILVKEYGVHHIWISDMDFIGSDREFAERFCDEVIKRGYDVTFEADCRVDSLDESLIQKLSRAGFYCLFLGIESFVDRQVADYSKFELNFNKSKIFRITELLRKYGMIPRYGFIMFDKDSTLDELIANHLIISSTVGYGTLDGLANRLVLLPGTKIESNYLKDTPYSYKVKIDEDNRLKPHLYYTKYRFKDSTTEFVGAFQIGGEL